MTMFATLGELADRIGAAELTDTQAAQGTLLLELATGLIVEAVDRDDTWAAALEEIPTSVRTTCVEMVARVMNNPTGARSQSETLGAHQYSTSFTDGAHGLELTASDISRCRRAILGQTSASARVESILRDPGHVAPPISGWIG